MKLMNTARYRAAIDALADAVAEMPVRELANSFGWYDVLEDLECALDERHPKKFGDALLYVRRWASR